MGINLNELGKKIHGKLEKRAERAESYVDSCVDLTLYYAAESQVDILEAAAARQDADDTQK